MSISDFVNNNINTKTHIFLWYSVSRIFFFFEQLTLIRIYLRRLESNFLRNKGGLGFLFILRLFCWFFFFNNLMKENWRKTEGKSNQKGDKTLFSAVHNLYEQLEARL